MLVLRFETMDMDRSTLKAAVLMVQKDPELFIWQRCLHAMHKGLPAWHLRKGSAGQGRNPIPDDGKEKLLRFEGGGSSKPMRGKSIPDRLNVWGIGSHKCGLLRRLPGNAGNR